MNWKAFLLQLSHAALGAGAAAGMAYINLPHVNPVIGAIIGSVISSLVSANSPQPNKQ